MKTIACFALLLFGLLASELPVQSARISEPATTFYGRVVNRAGDREFPVTSGELKWTLASPNEGGREYTFITHLEPLGDGRYSYRLTVPHQALAFDLTVADNNVPLTAAGWRLKHVQVLVNGEPATLVAPATDDFSARQADRAATYRIDLVLARSTLDSDGDGLPDWWEDQNGTDKWDPNDGPGSTLIGGANGNSTNDFTGHTFAEWRQHYFPNTTGDLQAFAQQDSDGDGISNLLEYAFDLDPRSDSSGQTDHLPLEQLVAGRFGVQFHKRNAATDLNYQVEYSEDLMQWRSDAAVLEEVAQDGASAGQTCICARSTTAEKSMLFLRVRVTLQPTGPQ